VAPGYLAVHRRFMAHLPALAMPPASGSAEPSLAAAGRVSG